MTKRKLRKKSCDGKVKYINEEDAERSAKAVHRKTGHWIEAYHCKFCGGFHIGHPPFNVRQSIVAQLRNKRKEMGL